MLSGFSYVIAKVVLVLPIMFIMGVFALGIPTFVLAGVPGEAAIGSFFLFAAMVFVFESVAEVLSIMFENPIMGMLVFMMFWCEFAAFDF